MIFENTVRGRSSAMTSDRGSTISGLLPMKSGRSIVVHPDPVHHLSVADTNEERLMKTVLITGCSSGYGLATARLFHAQGWSVIASMRTPREDVLPKSERLLVLPLDV